MEIFASGDAVKALSALAQPSRLAIFRLLVQCGPDGLAAGAIAAGVGIPASTLSAHLSILTNASLINAHRESRSIRYSVAFDGIRRLAAFLLEDCCGGQPEVSAPMVDGQLAGGAVTPGKTTQTWPKATDRSCTVLILCTGNSARSILAESLLNRLGQGHFEAFSAGSQPAGAVNPLTLDLLRRHDYPVTELRSKSWDEFSGPTAPAIDIVLTVCSSAASETCPLWPGHPMTAHWGMPDPAAVTGSDSRRQAAFEETYRILDARIGRLVDLPMATLDRSSLHEHLTEIGRYRPPDSPGDT